MDVGDVTLYDELAVLRQSGEQRAEPAELWLLSAIFRQSPHGMLACDRSGRLLLHNPVAEQIWRMTGDPTAMHDLAQYRVRHPDGRAFAPDDWPLMHCLRTGETVHAQKLRGERFDGTECSLLCSSAPILGVDGELAGALTVFADITNWKASEQRTDAHRRASFLSEVGTVLLSSALDLPDTLARTAQLAVDMAADGCVIEIVGEASLVAHASADKRQLLWDALGSDAANSQPGVLGGLGATHATLVQQELGAAFAHAPQRLAALHALGAHSLLIVPLRARGQRLGAIALLADTTGDYRYEDADCEMAERLAQKAALAIENATLYRAERRARARIERAAERSRRMQAIMAKLASALSTEQVAQAVIDHGVGAVGAKTAALWLVDAGAEHARGIGTYGFSDAASQRFARLPLSASQPVSEAIRRADMVVVESRADYERAYPESAAHLRDLPEVNLFAVVALPLIADNQVIGALTFAWEGDRRIDDDERGFLLLLAAHCAQGFARARLYEAEQRARAEIALLYGLVDSVSQASSLDSVYALALDAVEQALRADRSSILLFDAGGVMRFKAWRGLSEAYRAAVEGHSPWSHDTPDPQPVITADVEQDAGLHAYLPVLHAEGIRALAFVPLVHRQRLLGKFMIYSGNPRTFTTDELRMARNIATEVAHAIARKLGEEEIARLFAEAQTARAAAESASRMKDEFLGVVSHELRTPLSAILGWSAILQREANLTPATREKGLLAIERNASAQLKIIEDILDVSRIITGKLVIAPEPTGLSPLVVEAIDAVRASASAKDITLHIAASEDALVIPCDPERVRQIVWNLLSNAIKFTPRGGEVIVALERDDQSIMLSVTDSGSGIPAEFLPHVFERFRQADSSTTRAQSGLGLGLAIVRHLVELHGGQVSAHSAGVGHGSTFTVRLPHGQERLSRPPAELPLAAGNTLPTSVPPTNNLTQLDGKRVLLVDDDRDAREMLEQALLLHGAHVAVASNTQEALDLVSQFHPDVLVSDIGMPGEDGYGLIRRIRSLTSKDRELRAIAFTAYARQTDRRRALDAGYDEHVAKPVDVAVLARLVHRVARRAHVPRGPARPSE